MIIRSIIGIISKNRNIDSDTNLNISSYVTGSGASSVNLSLVSVSAGALLVVSTSTEVDSSALANATISSSPSLTWTKRSDAGASESGNAEIWTAVFTDGGNITVTTQWLNPYRVDSVCYVMENQEETLGGNAANSTGQSSPSVGITTTRSNSIIIGVSSDWNAIDGSSRVYRDSEVETRYFSNPGVSYTCYHYYKIAPSISTYTLGLSSPTGQSVGTALYEIRGN